MSSGFKCRKCYVVVSSQSALVAHYAVAHCRSSSMIPPDHGSLVCPHCDDRYASAEWLSEHVRDAHGEPAAARDHQMSATRDHQTSAARDHQTTAARDHQTSAARDRQTSAAAAESTDDEMTFKCCFCSSEFATQTLLSAHTAGLCSGLQCDVCLKSFRLKGVLTRHRKTVHGIGDVPVFMCELCAKSFRRKDNMRKHMKLMHGVVS